RTVRAAPARTRRARPRPELRARLACTGVRPFRLRRLPVARCLWVRARPPHALVLRLRRAGEPQHVVRQYPRLRARAAAVVGFWSLLAFARLGAERRVAFARSDGPLPPAGLPHRRAAPVLNLCVAAKLRAH